MVEPKTVAANFLHILLNFQTSSIEIFNHHHHNYTICTCLYFLSHVKEKRYSTWKLYNQNCTAGRDFIPELN